MKFLAKTTEQGGIHFESDYVRGNFIEFCKKNPGIIIELTPRLKVTREARGYFYGALVPAFCDWSEHYDPMNNEDRNKVAEVMLIEFFGEWAIGLKGEPIKIRKSTKNSETTSQAYRDGIERTVEYFRTEGIPVPNPDLYKKWVEEFQFDSPGLDYWEFLAKYNIKCDGMPHELEAVEN